MCELQINVELHAGKEEDCLCLSLSSSSFRTLIWSSITFCFSFDDFYSINGKVSSEKIFLNGFHFLFVFFSCYLCFFRFFFCRFGTIIIDKARSVITKGAICNNRSVRRRNLKEAFCNEFNQFHSIN